MRKTPSTTTTDWGRGLVGQDRDAGALAATLQAGASLLVAGPRGSGRSYLLRAVTAELERMGRRPAVLRPSATLTDVPFGAVDAADHPLLTSLRGAGTPSEGGVIVVDDVDALDSPSAAALVRAVAARRLTALIGLRTARARSLDRADDTSDVRRWMLDLWLEGAAKRIDLGEVTASEANDLVMQFPGVDRLDSATRAGLIWRADGSRALLRHLVLEAVASASAGRDPLRALQSLSPQSRLAVAVERHVDDLAPGDLECLAVVRRLPHLEMAVATRLFPTETVKALVASGLLHADASSIRRLTANDLIARAAQERVGCARIDAIVRDAGARMPFEADEWWSVPISLRIAGQWHRRGLSALPPGSIDRRRAERRAQSSGVKRTPVDGAERNGVRVRPRPASSSAARAAARAVEDGYPRRASCPARRRRSAS